MFWIGVIVGITIMGLAYLGLYLISNAIMMRSYNKWFDTANPISDVYREYRMRVKRWYYNKYQEAK